MARRIIPIAMPKWGMEMIEGQIASWNKAEGDAVATGDDLLEIETDKVTNVYEAENDGVLRRRIGLEGTIYPVGALLAVVADAEVPDADIEGFIRDFAGPADAEAPPSEAPAAAVPSLAPPAGYAAAPNVVPAPDVDEQPAGRLDGAAVEAQLATLKQEISPIAARVAIAEGIDLTSVIATGRLGRISLRDVETVADRPVGAGTRRPNVSPRARKLAREQNVDLGSLRGKGAGGRIHAADVLAAASAPPAARPLAANVRVGAAGSRSEPNSAMRRTIARRLVQSKTTAPHIYLRASIAMGDAMRLREGLNKRLPGGKVSINDLLVRAAGLALVETPDVNVQYTDESMLYFDQADICVAIALPQGLVAPVVRGVDRKPVTQIAEEIRELASRARAGALGAADLEGGTFSVSNLGMFGIESFDAVINPPQAAILAAGAITEKAVRVDGRIDLQSSMSVTLSCDHRAIDGAAGARFLAALKDLLENPVSLVM